MATGLLPVKNSVCWNVASPAAMCGHGQSRRDQEEGGEQTLTKKLDTFLGPAQARSRRETAARVHHTDTNAPVYCVTNHPALLAE